MKARQRKRLFLHTRVDVRLWWGNDQVLYFKPPSKVGWYKDYPRESTRGRHRGNFRGLYY